MTPTTESKVSMFEHYIVVTSSDLQALVMDVNDVMKTRQWAVAGGVSYDTEKKEYMQALVRI